jgi:hypothetical protein
MYVILLVLFPLVALSDSTAEKALSIPPEYNLPADELTLLRYLDKISYIDMRKHAWNVWAGITHETNSGESVFETWYPADNVFASDEQGAGYRRDFTNHLEPVMQHQFTAPNAAGESMMAHVLYNQPARDHIRENKLYLAETYDSLNKQFDKENLPRWDRSVAQFPRDAVVLKPVWWHVKKGEPTALPVWDGPFMPKDANGIYPAMPAEGWPFAVAIIPPDVKMLKKLGSVKKTNPNQLIREAVPLSDFYYFEITKDMIDHLSKEQDGFADVQPGDYAVMIAMHVTTREIHNWVWATFWWHDKPNMGDLAYDRPDSVKGVFRHFRMNTAFSMDTPGAADKGAHISYNPYIEGKFVNGVVSNCASCHNRAASPALSDDFCGALPITRGSYDFQPTSPERLERVKLEFLWSLLIRSTNQLDCMD